MKKAFLILLSIFSLTSCDYYLVKDHRDHIGVIQKGFWEREEDFQLCFEEKIFPYYYGRKAAGFAEGKDVLRKYFYSQYSNRGITNESGYVTVRFIINCKGEAGRFELLQTGLDFKKKRFSPLISRQLLELTRKLESWRPLEYYGDRYDSFFHLSFKITNGDLEEILP